MKFESSPTEFNEYFFRFAPRGNALINSFDVETPGIGAVCEVGATWVRFAVLKLPGMKLIAQRTSDEDAPARNSMEAMHVIQDALQAAATVDAEESLWIIRDKTEWAALLERFTRAP